MRSGTEINRAGERGLRAGTTTSETSRHTPITIFFDWYAFNGAGQAARAARVIIETRAHKPRTSNG